MAVADADDAGRAAAKKRVAAPKAHAQGNRIITSIVNNSPESCQKEIAAEIIKGEGDYVLALKENHPALYQAVDQFSPKLTKTDVTRCRFVRT